MADPFDVRMRFTSQLQYLNASVTSARKAAQFALKYRDMGEDLHSCILEQLERNNMNVRVNILYFIEAFLDLAQKDGNTDYVRMMQRDIIRIVDAVAPDNGSGVANVKVVRKVLHNLQGKSLLDAKTVTEIEEVLKERDTVACDMANSSPAADGGGASLAYMPPSQTLPNPRRSGHAARTLDRKQIEQRIEEDRERHKLLREGIWAIPPGPNAERDRLWEETSDLDDDDHLMGEEEYDERAKTLQTNCPTCQRGEAELNGTHAH